MKKTIKQFIPTDWSEREKLRDKGQFWTPDWIAQLMVRFALSNGSKELFDPAVGAGAFFVAADNFSKENAQEIEYYGRDIDPDIFKICKSNGLSDQALSNIEIRDFITDPPNRSYKSIVANPPYIRHHRIDNEVKLILKNIAREIIGTGLDGRAGIHVFFLIRALNLLAPNGNLAFILPADTVEGIFSNTLWKWISNKFKIEAIINFNKGSSPFPRLDVNPMIFLIKNDKPLDSFKWLICKKPETNSLWKCISSGYQFTDDSFEIIDRNIAEALETGLSRIPSKQLISRYKLLNFAYTMRGIATGANDFFLLSKDQVEKFEIPDEFIKIALSRTRDIQGNIINDELINKLISNNYKVFLFCPDGRPLDEFPESVKKYILLGEKMNLPFRPLIQQRRPWYKMETREVPEFFFAYLGRRNARFIRNEFGALPLNGFLCVYSKLKKHDEIQNLWKILDHEKTIANLYLVGKSYGHGAIKVEPRALEKLSIPEELVRMYLYDDQISWKQDSIFSI